MGRARHAKVEDWGPPGFGPDDTELEPAPPPTEEDRRQRRLLRNIGTTMDRFLVDGPWVQVGEPPLVVRYEPSSRWVPIGTTALPEHFTAVVTDSRYPMTLLDLAVDAGSVVIDRITFVRGPTDPPIRVTKLRAPVDRFRLEAAGVVAAEIRSRPDGTLYLAREDETLDAFDDAYRKHRRERGRGAPLEDDLLKRVAQVYREALTSRPARPTRAVESAFLVSRSNASRWVAEARKRGFLGAAVPRRAGELRSKSRKEKGHG